MNKYWVTPLDIMTDLHSVYEFDYDPCPNPVPDGYNGLQSEWGNSNWVNPPFDNLMSWARKSVKEYKKGRKVVFCLPCYATGVVSYLCEHGGNLRYLGRVRWHELSSGELEHFPDSKLSVILLVTFGYDYLEYMNSVSSRY